MGLFSQLKDIRGVEKLVKFKQGKLMEAARSKGLLAEDLFTRTKKGACAAYTMAWLQEKYDPAMFTNCSQFERSKSVDSSEATTSIRTAASHAHFQGWYRERGLPSLFMTYGMRPSGLVMKADDLYALLTDCSAKLSRGSGAFIDYRCNRESEDRHAVGLFRENDQYVHYFDSNIGEYRIDSERSLKDFATQYLVSISVHYEQSPGECTARVMEKGTVSIPGGDF